MDGLGVDKPERYKNSPGQIETGRNLDGAGELRRRVGDGRAGNLFHSAGTQ